jgi:uncharacterized protein
MQSKLINDGPPKTYVLVLDKGDQAVSSIESFARDNGISAAQLTGLGAFSDAVLGFFGWETKDYRKIPVKEQVEVVPCSTMSPSGPGRQARPYIPT